MFPIALYPRTALHRILRKSERAAYHRRLNAELVIRHSLFHTHVDPTFIKLAEKAHFQGRPWVHTYHALYFSDDWNGQLKGSQLTINDCLLRHARNADVCLSVGSWLAQWLRDAHGIESRYLPNGVDLRAIDNAVARSFSQKYGLSDFVLFVGSHESVKDPMMFIDTARRWPDLQFLMIGRKLTPQDLQRRFSIAIPKNLIALGPLPYRDVLNALAACLVFVMTSRREGLPTALLEAMALRKPCVVPDAPGFYDAIQSPLHGFLFERKSQEDLDAKLAAALSVKSLPVAREHVETHFSWREVITQLDNIYGDLLGRPIC